MTRPFVWLVMRLRFAVVAGWIVVAVLSATQLPGLAGVEEAALGGLVPSDAPAIGAERRSVELFRAPLLSRAVVVQRNPERLSEVEQAASVRQAVAISRGEIPLFRTIVLAVPIPNAGGLFPTSQERGTTIVTYLYFKPTASLNARSALADSYGQRLIAPRSTYVGSTGAAPARIEQWHAIEDALPLVELGTVIFILAVVGLTFRSVGAPLVALGAAGISYFVALGVVGWVGQRFDIAVPREVEPVMLVLLLGVVTDYAVFFLASVRRRLHAGMERVEAAEDAARQNVPIITTTGLIVACGTAALLVGRLEFFRAFGPGAALTVLVALAVSLTFIPAALAVFGRAVFFPSLARPAVDEAPAPEQRSRFVHWLTVRPVAIVVALVVVCGFAFLTAPLASTKLGYTLLTGLPDGSDAERALFEASKGFAPGIVAPTEVLVEGDGVHERRDALRDLQRALERQPGVAGVVGVRRLPPDVEQEVFLRKDAARFGVILASDPLGGAAIERVNELKDALPRLLDEAGLEGATFGVAGDTALAAETIELMKSDIVRIALAALAVNFVFLALFLRSLVAPLLLLLASSLSLAAALGVTSFVFRALGYGDLTYYVPFAAAVLLLSLGSDYTLFIVGRIWQEARERTLREGMQIAVPRASRAVTVAGVALAGSFALLALVPLRPFREFAFAMAVGILVDTFIVRPLLVPALLASVGERSRWPARRGTPVPVEAPSS